MGFPRQEYWSGLPFPFPGYLPQDQSSISIVSCIADGFFWGSPAPGIVEPNRKKRSTSSFLAKWVWKSFIRVRLFVIPWTSPWNSPGQNTGVGRLSLLQGIEPRSPHCRQILYQLSHKGSPRILEWVAYPFSRGSSQPRNQTRVSCIAGRFFSNWASGKPLSW